jgi:hypothetical protein
MLLMTWRALSINPRPDEIPVFHSRRTEVHHQAGDAVPLV